MSMDNSKNHLRWGDSNAKVMKLKAQFEKVLTFDLPAYQSADGFRVCPGAGACKGPCYAQQGNYNFPNVKRNLEHNLAFARRNIRSFTRAVISDLARLKPNLIRLHSSGDFFNQAYLNAWFKVAKTFPGIRVYCYTKSLHLDFSGKPDNFAITQSEGGIWDAQIDESKSHARIFTSKYARLKAGYAQGSHSDLLAVNATDGTRIGLEYHGSKNLTDAQKKYFSGSDD